MKQHHRINTERQILRWLPLCRLASNALPPRVALVWLVDVYLSSVEFLFRAVHSGQQLMHEWDAEVEEAERGLLKGNLFPLSLCWVKRK